MNPRRVAVIGAGYAGLAAAVDLVEAGFEVDVFEASKTLGGRARGVSIDGQALDNGAHILVGAYAETLRLMRLVGVPADALERMPLRLEIAGHFRLTAPSGWPAPLHLAWALITAKGLKLSEKLAAISFMRRWQAREFRITPDLPVSELLSSQPERLRGLLWEPLCLAALNTPVREASGQTFLNVLRDSLAASASASDLLLPACDLSAMFPEPAASHVEERGSRVHRTTRIQRIRESDGAYHADEYGPYAQVVLAVAPYHLPALIADLPATATLAHQMEHFDWQPIVTCYLRYPVAVSLPAVMTGIHQGVAQWLFDLAALRGMPGMIAAVISAEGPHRQLSQDDLAHRIHAEVSTLVPNLPSPQWHRVVTEQRATFACRPQMHRPATETALPGLWLAGDYVAGDFPATIEGAVRSGVRAAASVIDHASRREP